MSLIWGGSEPTNDRPRRRPVKIRCAEDLSNHGDCQWRGNVWAVLSYGTVDLSREECEECGGAVELDD